ncbi:MAG: peptide deformylase [Erysipelotrichaceae bacterium]|nr:peptide deformylase [Erysipelotrichaceae bacterium]
MLKIVKDNVKSLREKSVAVDMPASEKELKLLNEMLDYLKKSQDDEYAKKHNMRAGVGLAAPQVGVNKRMLVVYYQDEDNKEILHMLINPKIVASSIKTCYIHSGEGCLSVDVDHEGYVYRPYKVTIKAFDASKMQDVTIVARGFEAIVLQHEIDHLNGVLYYDHIDKINPFKKEENSVEL